MLWYQVDAPAWANSGSQYPLCLPDGGRQPGASVAESALRALGATPEEIAECPDATPPGRAGQWLGFFGGIALDLPSAKKGLRRKARDIAARIRERRRLPDPARILEAVLVGFDYPRVRELARLTAVVCSPEQVASLRAALAAEGRAKARALASLAADAAWHVMGAPAPWQGTVSIPGVGTFGTEVWTLAAGGLRDEWAQWLEVLMTAIDAVSNPDTELALRRGWERRHEERTSLVRGSFVAREGFSGDGGGYSKVE